MLHHSAINKTFKHHFIADSVDIALRDAQSKVVSLPFLKFIIAFVVIHRPIRILLLGCKGTHFYLISLKLQKKLTKATYRKNSTSFHRLKTPFFKNKGLKTAFF
jgi:hypothetical protein